MDLEVKHLRLIAAVAEEGNLTRAGERLHLTQSALSHQLLDLEERLGTSLFHRIGRRMVLTQGGDRIHGTAMRVLADLTRTEEDVRALAHERAGVLRLTTECFTCYHWLPPLMKQFQTRYPDVDIRIDAEATARPLEALLEGQLEIAIISSQTRNRKIVLRPLFEDELVVIVAPEHCLAARPHVTARDLAKEHLLIYGTLADNAIYQRLLRPRGLVPHRITQVQLTEAILELVKAGMGVSVQARWAIAPDLERGTVVGLPLTRHGFPRLWQAATLRGEQPRYITDFIDLIARQASRVIPVRRRHSR